MEQFAYTPLAHDEIRLIHLAPKDTTSPLTTQPYLSLHTTKLILKPHFEALSYQWTPAFCSQTHKLPIQIHSRQLSVNENLYQALQHLRLVSEERIIWIDAICINQEDEKEKEWHVNCMDEIYKAACHVVAWLGQPGALEIELVERVKELLLACEKTTLECSVGDVKMLAKICDNGYWTRTWVIQEVVLARKITVLYGTTQLSFDSLTDGTKWKELRDKNFVTKKYFEGMLASNAIRLRQLRDKLNGDTHSRMLGMPLLLAWIEHGAKSECFIKQDEIFALRSFAKKCCRDVTPVKYQQDGRQLFITLTNHHFAEHRFEGEEWLLICVEVEFHAKLLQRYPVDDAGTLLPVGLGDLKAMGVKYGNDPLFALAIASVEMEMASQMVKKATKSWGGFKSTLGLARLHAMAVPRAVVDGKWRENQIMYWLLMREHVIGLVNPKEITSNLVYKY